MDKWCPETARRAMRARRAEWEAEMEAEEAWRRSPEGRKAFAERCAAIDAAQEWLDEKGH